MRVSLDSADPRSSQFVKHRNSSTINFSLYTPDSPTAVYDFEEIARAFPLPLSKSEIPSARTGRDRDIGPLDFPVEIALLDEEEELGRELESNSGGSRRGSESWRNKDLAAWRSQCHRDANVSAISLPVVGERHPAASDKRNLSVISLPTVMPELSDHSAISTTFTQNTMGDQTFTGIQPGYRIESSKNAGASAESEGRLPICEDEDQTSPRNSQGENFDKRPILIILADLKVDMISISFLRMISTSCQSCNTVR